MRNCLFMFLPVLSNDFCAKETPLASDSFVERPTPGRQRLFPLAAVELSDLERLDGSRIKAARVDAVPVRMRARHVERLHAASRAEEMPRHAGVERVRGERILAPKQAEPRLRHDQMQVAGFGADRAVALGDLQSGWGLDFETDPTAVTTALMDRHARTS